MLGEFPPEGSSGAGRNHLWHALVVACLLAGGLSPAVPALAAVPPDIRVVTPDGETVPVGTSGDSADDPAIWVNPADPSLSIVIGNDKGDALEVYDLSGNRLQTIAGGHGNVDVRRSFPLNGGTADIAAASRSGLRIYQIDPASRTLTNITDDTIATNSGEGLCMYHSPTSGRFYVFQVTRPGEVQQWWIRDADGDGLVDGELVRSFTVGSEAEGCVADDGLGYFYVAEEDVAIWKYGAGPTSGTDRTAVDSVGASGHLVSDVEGLTLVYQPDGNDFLLASAQNVADPTANYYTIYRRQGDNAYVDAFRVGVGTVADGCSRTDGIDAVSADLGADFPSGLFVCQDDANTTPGGSGNQNFKLVRLEKILGGISPETPPGPDVTPPETIITAGPGGSVTGSSATLSFASNEAGSTFACSLDDALPLPCTSPVTYSDLGLGDHRFQVGATDPDGNSDPSPALRTWTRVEAPPGPLTLLPTDDAQVAQRTPNTSSGAWLRLRADASPVVESFLRFQVPATETAVVSARLRLWVRDGAANGPKIYGSDPDWTEAAITWNNRPARTPGVVADIGTVATNRYVDWDVSSVVTGAGSYSFDLVADSSNSVEFNAKEASSNRPQLVVDLASDPPPPDTTPPETTITGGPSGTVASTTASFSFIADETATFTCSLDGTAPPVPCTSPQDYSGLNAGPHNFEVTATDTANNTDQTPATRDWTIDTTPPPDTTPPQTTIMAGPSGTVASTTASFSFSADETATFTCSLDGAIPEPCGSPTDYSGLTDGPHNLEVTATDTAGNVDATPATRDWTINTTPPPSLGVISTLAGTGVRGAAGDGGPASSAQLSAPRTTATDAAGNTFVADTENHRIRRISAAGIITTVAGTGVAGYGGDGGLATAARFNNPHGVAVDAAGNVYVADSANHRIRRITPAGTITTIAGTGVATYNGDGIPAVQAALAYPKGVELAPDGSLYVGDANNHRVRQFFPGGTITTVAGTGTAGYSGNGGPATSARLRLPRNIAFGPDGSFYIADDSNYVVRRVDPAGVITTVAGTGTAGFSGDGGPATSAQLRRVRDVAVDAAGNLYIADQQNHRIRRVSPAGVITTFAGTGTAGSSGDGGPAAAARVAGPRGVEVTPTGTILIADTGSHRIRRVN